MNSDIQYDFPIFDVAPNPPKSLSKSTILFHEIAKMTSRVPKITSGVPQMASRVPDMAPKVPDMGSQVPKMGFHFTKMAPQHGLLSRKIAF